MRIAIAAAVACLSIVGVTATAQVHAAVRQHTEIPAESLDLALRMLAKDRGFQVVYLSEDVRALQTRGAVGDFTVDEALKKLLSDSQLEYKFVDENTVSVFGASASAATSAGADQNRTANNERGGGKSNSREFRVAQLDQTPPGPRVANLDAQKKAEPALTEIVVTGTHIHGETASLSPIMTFDRDAIDRSGYVNTQDFIQSIPQAFAGGAQGASPDGLLGSGATAGGNIAHASAINLRGLGENSTLTLLNGHRIATSDLGNVVDISTIPLSAIDHIDVLTDGASAIYGSDAVAGVVNIILRKEFQGADTQLTYGGAGGGLRNEIFAQTVGTEWGTGSIMASYQYQHDGTLPTTARTFTAGAPQVTNLINPFTENSLVVDGEQQLIEGLKLEGDVLATWKRTESVISYGFGQSSETANPSAINAHLGLSYAITDRWLAELVGTYSRQATDQTYTENPYGYPNGSPLVLYRGRVSEYELNVSGSLWTLPGGDIGVAFGGSRRSESGEEKYPDPVVGVPVAPSRNITSEYAETSLPFVSAQNAIPAISRLIVSAAVRHDQYSDFGGTTNPKIGLLWSPVPFLDLKANWSKAFRAPSIGEQILNFGTGFNFAYILGGYANPSGPSTVPVLYVGGSNPQLQPETATTYDVGFEIRVPNIPNLKFSVDYYNVDFKNRIESPNAVLNMLLHPNIYGSLITNFPNDAAAAGYVTNLESKGYQLLDVGFGTSPVGLRYAFAGYLQNAAIVQQNGLDFTGQYAFNIRREAFQTGLNVAFINKIDTQFAPGTTAANLINTYSNPLRLRLRWDGAWVHGPSTFAAAINFSNAYTNPNTLPSSDIASFTTVDVSDSIQLARNDPSSLLHGMSVRVGATNLLGRYPPYAQTTGTGALHGVNYDVGNASPLGRVLNVQFVKKW